MDATDTQRRKILKTGLATASLFLPVPYAWVWAQSEGTLKLLKLPKVALVLGNSRYKDAPLANPANDAKAIAEALSLGLSSMAFLDDNPAERELVRRFLPEVAVPELPPDPALYARTLEIDRYHISDVTGIDLAEIGRAHV